MAIAAAQNDPGSHNREASLPNGHYPNSAGARRAYLTAALCFFAAFLLACRAGSDLPDSSEIGLYNAYWNCPTPSPVPTQCWQEPYPGPTVGSGTPTAEPILQCTTPLPTATPYGLQMMPDAHTTANFYIDQQVRMGPLRMSLTSYSTTGTLATPGPTGMVAHLWTFEIANEGGQTLTVTWPLRTIMREVATGSGEVLSGRWGYTERAGRAAGAVWQDGWAVLHGGEARSISVAIEAPQGRGLAVGFAPDLSNPDLRYDAGSAQNIIWFRPADDPSCQGNTSGPVTSSDQGGAVWQQPLNKRTPVIDGSFQGWPVRRGTYISQDFGCTAFPEIAGYDCPPGRPWFHAGVDFADSRGTPLYAVTEGVVTYVGVSQGVRCTFPGAEEPRANLGWVIVIQSGSYTIKYGHTVVGSERVQAGDHVTPGQVLALMGSTGCSTGPHLHFQVQLPGQGFVDPFNLLGVNAGSGR
ncbi:MAG: M23 family metallopeptidase [Chloroflexi bacterium]|nr:M23 family metallopeptidase [Chloroflexota bacterium]